MRLSNLIVTASFSAAVCLTVVPAFAATSGFEFIYITGSTVETYTVPNPPIVDGFDNGSDAGKFLYSTIQTESGTLNGTGYGFGDIQLYHYSNFNASGIFTADGTTEAGPYNHPLYSGLGQHPQIITGTYALTNFAKGQTTAPTPATLYIVAQKPIVFTLSGSIDAVLNFEDYPQLALYGSHFVHHGADDYLRTDPVFGTLNGVAFKFGSVDFFDQNGGFSTTFGGLDFGSIYRSYGVAKLFSGPLYAPTFNPGVYQLGDGETLTITAPDGLPAAIPEPSAWAMMLAGLGVLGGFARRRRAVLAPG